jgi:hypothetical protein
MTRSRSLGKLPSDPQARERLREAQVAEARALTAVYTAEAALTAALEEAARADAALAVARATLIGRSGLDRAASLLAVSKTELRRSVAAAASNGASS